MKTTVGMLIAGLLIGAAAQAAPVDFKDHIPADVTDMKQLRLDQEGDMLIALYEGKAGRATLSIMAAPTLAAGETGYDPAAVSGQTVPAQRVLLAALQENLERGTKALGDSYDTSVPRFEPVEMKDEGGATMQLACASVLRQQPGGAADALHLLDRLCSVSKGETVALVRMTAPFERPVLEAQSNAQLAFAGELFQRLFAEE